MKNILAMLLHPFAIVFYALIIGAFLVLNNEKNADDTIPVFFYGDWSIYLGYGVWAGGAIFLAYCIWKSAKDKKEKLKKKDNG